MTQEQLYLTAPQAVTSYQLNTNILTMMFPGGTLTFYDQSTLPRRSLLGAIPDVESARPTLYSTMRDFRTFET